MPTGQFVLAGIEEDDESAVTFLGGPFSEAEANDRRDEIFAETDDHFSIAVIPIHSIKTLEEYNEENPEED